MSSATDVDWYEFEVDYQQIQILEGINDGTKSWATTFDIDFGSGVRGDYTISVFDADTNELIYVGRDSNIADDIADPSQGDTDADDLTRGSAGVNDPFIGTVQLTEGTYYVAVSTNAQLPNQLDQNFVSAATNPKFALSHFRHSIELLTTRLVQPAISRKLVSSVRLLRMRADRLLVLRRFCTASQCAAIYAC